MQNSNTTNEKAVRAILDLLTTMDPEELRNSIAQASFLLNQMPVHDRPGHKFQNMVLHLETLYYMFASIN